MNKIAILTVFIYLITLLMPVIAGEERDFGLRIDGGGFYGIGSEMNYEIGVGTDFYFLSENFRMTFGTSFIVPKSDYIPLTAVHYLGIEYNIPIYKNFALLGFSYYKPYLKEIKNNLSGKKGWSYYLGYKYILSEVHDIVFLIGAITQPFVQSVADPNFQLQSHTIFFRLGTEWYF